MSVNESNHLRDDFFKLNRELCDKSLRLSLRLDQEEWSALHHTEGTLATAAVYLMSRHHGCPTAITINADKLENCLTSLMLNIQSL